MQNRLVSQSLHARAAVGAILVPRGVVSAPVRTTARPPRHPVPARSSTGARRPLRFSRRLGGLPRQPWARRGPMRGGEGGRDGARSAVPGAGR